MEQQQSRQNPQMPQETYGQRMWQLWGPILIKWAIAIGVSVMAMMALAAVYSLSNEKAIMEAVHNEAQMMNLYEDIFREYLKASAWIEGVTAVVTIPVMLYWFHRDRVKEKMMGVAVNKKAPLWKYAAVILMAIAMCLGLNNLIAIGNLSAMSEAYVETLEALYSSPLAVQIISLGVLIPICEELVFRGLLFQRLRMRGTYMQAALYSAVVFGLMHGNLVQVIYGFTMGMMLAYVYEKYGSVKAPIAAHMSMNILSVLLTEYRIMGWLMEDIMRIGVVTVVCAAVASTMFVWIQRIEEKPEVY